MIVFTAFTSLILALLPHIIWLLCAGTAKLFGHGMRYAPFGWIALAIVFAFWCIMLYGNQIGRFNLRVKEIPLRCEGLPETFSGLRIVHISDLHLSTFDDKPRQLKRFVKTINEQNPDIICFTGDLVSLGVNESGPYTEELKKLHARYGVFSVLGNHDFLIYDRNFTEEQRLCEVEKLAAFERDSLGWRLLRNEHVTLEAADSEQLTIIGVDNKNCTNQGFQTIDCGDLEAAMAGTSGYRILLTHDPSHWDAEVLGKTDIQLTLSGHTHAAQIKLFGWSPASWVFNRVCGIYEENGQVLHVNPGLGCTLPVRVGARPEISVIIAQ